MTRPTIKTSLPALLLALAILGAAASSCKQKGSSTLKAYPCDGLAGVIDKKAVSIDQQRSADGSGSIQALVPETKTVRLYKTGDLDVEDAKVVYRAKIKAARVKGKVYLEMYCHFPGKGSFFSRGLDNPIVADTDWAEIETVFILKKGENPDNIHLNVRVDGSADIWIDDIRLIKEPL